MKKWKQIFLEYFDINQDGKISWWEFLIPFAIIFAIEFVIEFLVNLIL